MCQFNSIFSLFVFLNLQYTINFNCIYLKTNFLRLVQLCTKASILCFTRLQWDISPVEVFTRFKWVILTLILLGPYIYGFCQVSIRIKYHWIDKIVFVRCSVIFYFKVVYFPSIAIFIRHLKLEIAWFTKRLGLDVMTCPETSPSRLPNDVVCIYLWSWPLSIAVAANDQ